MTVYKLYQAESKARGFGADSAQLRALQALQSCARDWGRFKEQRSSTIKKLLYHPVLPRGVYLYGGVGRGKSFLLDVFYSALPLQRKTRLHFHEFMREVHGELRLLKGAANPLDVLAARMAQQYRLLCFDEFHISDITDALILHRLLAALFERGVGMVSTSNYHPNELYPNGLHRARILPAIELLKQRMHVVHVDGEIDYRSQSFAQCELYQIASGASAHAAMQNAFERLADRPDEDPVLQIEARPIRAQRRAGALVWFDFKTLCASARSPNDYLEIASRFHTLLLSDVPQLPAHLAAQARRLSWLVDVLYDRHVKLLVSAAVPVEQLYCTGHLANEFVRTVSRLQEMQTAQYLTREFRLVNTRLT